MNALYLPAHAKLNLTLRILGRREDGYHLLDSVFHTIDWHDDLWLQATDTDAVALEVTSEGERSDAPAGPDNLVMRALVSLRAAAEHAPGFRVRLHKRIPAGGGLGGGSSDAAAALRLGNACLPDPVSDAVLFGLAQRLGADVPFFLRGGSQRAQGIGDELTPVVVAPRHFVLLVPPFDCPTAEVYKNHAAYWIDARPEDTSGVASETTTVPVTGDSALRIRYSNDLQRAAEVVRPALSALRQRAAELGGVSVHLTGSGSTLFVGCDDEAAARRCERDLAPLLAAGTGIVRTASAGALETPHRMSWPGDAPGAGGQGR